MGLSSFANQARNNPIVLKLIWHIIRILGKVGFICIEFGCCGIVQKGASLKHLDEKHYTEQN